MYVFIEYSLKYVHLGMVVHLQSKCVICIMCRKGFPLNSVLNEHFTSQHKLPAHLRRYNEITGNKLEIHDIQQGLYDVGARFITDHGLYITPLKEALPMISALEVKEGFMCGYCPVNGLSAVAKFTAKRTTMANHMSSNHRGLPADKYTACYVQHLFGQQAYKTYFKVERQYAGETVQTTFTADAFAELELFRTMNPTYSNVYNPDNDVLDSRVYSRFYLQMNWYDLVRTITGDDAQANRILLNNWVNSVTIQPTEQMTNFDRQLRMLVRHYFSYMQSILLDSSMNIYWYRQLVMQQDP